MKYYLRLPIVVIIAIIYNDLIATTEHFLKWCSVILSLYRTSRLYIT